MRFGRETLTLSHFGLFLQRRAGSANRVSLTSSIDFKFLTNSLLCEDDVRTSEEHDEGGSHISGGGLPKRFLRADDVRTEHKERVSDEGGSHISVSDEGGSHISGVRVKSNEEDVSRISGGREKSTEGDVSRISEEIVSSVSRMSGVESKSNTDVARISGVESKSNADVARISGVESKSNADVARISGGREKSNEEDV